MDNYIEEQKYLLAKKRVEKIKGFYVHLIVYVLVNIFVSGVVIYGLTSDEGMSFIDAITHPGIYMTWLGWGIGIFFHWLGVFGFPSFLSGDWEERKIKKLMEEDDKRSSKLQKRR